MNIDWLTQSHSAIAAKRSQKSTTVLFDDNARTEYLTGFHKRKLAKQDAARKKAKEREHQYRLQARREQRAALRQQAQENAAQVESAYAAHLPHDSADDDEWTGFSRKEDEYEGEDVVATVTVVDDFDPDELIHGPSAPIPSPPSIPQPTSAHPQHPPRSQTKPLPKSKPKKIKYETNAARKAQRTKQRARRTEKAERAGGKASRRKSSASNTKRR